MKTLFISLTCMAAICSNPSQTVPCGARVQEKEENHQVLNQEINDPAPAQNPKEPTSYFSEEDIQWKADPRTQGYEYYDKPNGVRVYRVRPCSIENKKYSEHSQPQVLNPELL